MFVALITGANKGIGYELAKSLGQDIIERKKEDGLVLLGSRDLGRGEVAAAEINQALGTSIVEALQLDVLDKDSIAAAANLVKTKFKGLDVLCCNAGWAPKSHQDPEEERGLMKKTFDTNYYGVRRCIDAFLTLMKPNGRIVITSSIVSVFTWGRMNEQNKRQLRDCNTLADLDRLADELCSFGDNGSLVTHGYPASAYGLSKLLVTKLCVIYGTFAVNGVLVTCAHPGYCKTDMAGWEKPPQTAAEGAVCLFHCCTLPEGSADAQGGYFEECKLRPIFE